MGNFQIAINEIVLFESFPFIYPSLYNYPK